MDLATQKIIALIVISILTAGGLLLVYGLRQIDERLSDEEKEGDKYTLPTYFVGIVIFTILYLYVFSES